LKGIPPKLIQHIIELDTSIPPTHQARYRLNLNYFATVKQDIDKLLPTWTYSTSREGYMVITHSGNAQEEWKIKNLCGFHKVE
jgi:hypothetical protein